MAKRMGETSYKETALGILPRSKLIQLEAEGIVKVWRYVLRATRPGTRITPRYLQKLHKIGFGWIFPDLGGCFRRVDVEVSNHKPPAFYLVPQLMVDFCEDLKERFKHLPSIDSHGFLEYLVDLLAWAHHRFLWVHPFQDYNGRIGRLLINVLLLKLGLPPIELKVETKRGRGRYIRALRAADAGDLRGLKRLVREATEEAASKIHEI